ncbi:hypothetical protein FACS189432_03920 [Bacteroidia bacterium]|nr:hypothetical protein FACS189426_11050 [Bacteroidia bacterium]GHT27418.1 hypothetical protein FACS189432_03920 [Bacteroidia bacterium]GHV71113.1 hypothetical protein FACS189420_4970 [Bacteroidia bacterium]
MKEIYYIYNNEAIASCVFLSVLDSLKTLDIARSCLILPFLLDDRTVNYLLDNQNNELTLEQMKKNKPLLFTSFNKRYLSLLPVTINSLMILRKSNQIGIGKEIHIVNLLPIYNSTMGERLNKIIDVIPTFLSVISIYSTNQLYKSLNIQL